MAGGKLGLNCCVLDSLTDFGKIAVVAREAVGASTPKCAVHAFVWLASLCSTLEGSRSFASLEFSALRALGSLNLLLLATMSFLFGRFEETITADSYSETLQFRRNSSKQDWEQWNISSEDDGDTLASEDLASMLCDLEEQAQLIDSFRFSHEGISRSLCKLCSSISFKALTSKAGFDHQPAGRKLREESESATGFILCCSLWKAISEDMNQKYSDNSNHDCKSEREYWLHDQDAVTSPYDEFPTLQSRLAVLESDPVKLFLNPLQGNRSDMARKAYQIREMSVWSANPEMLKKIDWYSDRDLEEASYQAPKLQGSQRDLSGHWTVLPGDSTRLRRLFLSAKFFVETTWGKALTWSHYARELLLTVVSR